MYIAALVPMGLNAWLLRQPDGRAAGSTAVQSGEAADDGIAFATARSAMLLAAALLACLGLVSLSWLERWVGDAGVSRVAVMMVPLLPVQALIAVNTASLERDLSYRTLAALELRAMVLLYVVGVALAVAGFGARGVAVGWAVQVIYTAWRGTIAAGRGVRLAWSSPLLREGLGFGLRLSASQWVWQLRDLVNPLIVGRFVGVDGVAAVALATRLIDAAAVVKTSVWRLALPALSKLQHDLPRLAAAVKEGTRIQVVTLGLSLGALTLVAPWAVPRLFGASWSTLASVLPLLAAGTLANAGTNLHSAALYALGRTAPVLRFHAAFVLCFGGAALLLVPTRGIVGVGLAELAALPAYAVIVAAYRRAVPPAMPWPDLVLAAVLVTAVAGIAVTPWASVGLLAPFTRADVRLSAGQAIRAARQGLAGGRA
jgi:O-antigen/teichoic acid export membrane protein